MLARQTAAVGKAERLCVGKRTDLMNAEVLQDGFQMAPQVHGAGCNETVTTRHSMALAAYACMRKSQLLRRQGHGGKVPSQGFAQDEDSALAQKLPVTLRGHLSELSRAVVCTGPSTFHLRSTVILKPEARARASCRLVPGLRGASGRV